MAAVAASLYSLPLLGGDDEAGTDNAARPRRWRSRARCPRRPPSARCRAASTGSCGTAPPRRVPEELHDAQFGRMARAGVESVRTVFYWSAAQPAAGQPPSFAATDHVVALAAARRIDVLPVVIYTPAWAAQYPGKVGSPPALPSDYAAYLTALVGRYGPKGTFWVENPALPEGADPALADLERAELRRLLARGGRRLVGARLRGAAQGLVHGHQERRPREPPWSWRASRTSRGTTWRTSTGRARRTRSTPWRSTRSPATCPT